MNKLSESEGGKMMQRLVDLIGLVFLIGINFSIAFISGSYCIKYTILFLIKNWNLK